MTKRKHFVKTAFVEGQTDVNFYSNFLHKRAGLKETELGYISCGGKSKVVAILNKLYDEELSYKKQYYIVDKDYNALTCVPEVNDPDKISMTFYYSFENYLFQTINISYIFEEYGLSELIREFVNNLNEYLDYITEMEALIYCQMNHLIHNVYSTDKFSSNCFVFEDRHVKPTDEFVREIANCVGTLDEKEYKEFIKAKEKISKKPLNIRGHEFELFFNCFCAQHGMELTFEDLLKNKKLINKMDINIVLK